MHISEVETFLHDLSVAELPSNYNIRRKKLESKVKLLRAKYHLQLHRVPLSSLRLAYDPFPKDLEIKRPRSVTSPDAMATYLPDVPEEDEACSPVPGGAARNLGYLSDGTKNPVEAQRPRSASYPLTL